MSVYLVSYDLSKPGRDYPRISEALKSYGTYSHALESVWLIETNQSAGEVRDYLQGRVDSDDKLLVVPVPKGWGWATLNLRDATNKWLKDVLSS